MAEAKGGNISYTDDIFIKIVNCDLYGPILTDTGVP